MKKLLTITLSLIISCSFAQWELYNPTPTDANLTDIFFVDDYNGWAVGEYGTILFTDDGGQNWISQLSISGPMESTFSAVYFTDLLNGWAVGSTYIPYGGAWSSLLYHTIDGGETWESQYSNPTESFTDVWFINADTGWVVGSESYDGDGIILYTEDGGMNWEEQYSKDNKYLNSICFTDAYNGCAVGAQGLIINTIDGGETWEDQSTNLGNFKSVCFTDWNNGWTICGPYPAKIKHTQDGGNSWEVNYELGNNVASVGTIFFVDANNGWVTYNTWQTEVGVIWHVIATTDGGATWSSYYDELSSDLFPSIHFIDPLEGWAVRNNVIIHSTDGGQNWLPQNTITQTNFNSICIVEDSSIWAAGDKGVGIFSYCNTLLYSNDAGTTWAELDWGGGKRIKDMYFIDENHGWIVTRSSHEDGGNIGRTIDGGLNWIIWQLENWEDLSSVYFIDSLNGWVVGHNGTILHTTNGGIDWIDESMIDYSLTFYDVFFTDLSNGWIVGTEWDEGITYGKVYYTNDGGGSWDEQYSMENVHFVSEYFTDQNNGWVVGDSIILHTSDGGINWIQQTSGVLQLNDVYFTDENNGWAVGNTDIIYTTNGGVNWITQTSGVHNNLNCVAFIDEDNGWIAGDNGVMLYTNNGGIPNDCLPEGITFTTQAQIDNFQINYPGCTEIEGDVLIAGEDINNLNGLNVLTLIGGNLWFANTALTGLTGLENLSTVAGNVTIGGWYPFGNNSLQSLTGLDGLNNIGGTLEISSNPVLDSLTGLNNLTTVGGNLRIGNGDAKSYELDELMKLNSSLKNLSGLNNLTTIGGSLIIEDNESLNNIADLANLNSIGGNLEILANALLTELTGLDNINADSIQSLNIYFNFNLSLCNVPCICDYLISPNGEVVIQNNAEGCNSQQEVKEACASSISEIGSLIGLAVSPNPFTTSTTIEYELNQPEKVILTIYDYLGKQVYQTHENQPQGKQQIIWNAEGYADGIYYFRLQVGDKVKNGKVVKVE